jgi:hypothetical protein
LISSSGTDAATLERTPARQGATEFLSVALNITVSAKH